MKIYGVYYQESRKSSTGFPSNPGPRENTVTREEAIYITLCVPILGLVQDPDPLNLKVSIDSVFLVTLFLIF